jgi:hypothetical protein
MGLYDNFYYFLSYIVMITKPVKTQTQKPSGTMFPCSARTAEIQDKEKV